MQKYLSQLLATTVAVGVLMTSSTFAADDTSPADLASKLSEGGYVIYIRHTSTEKDYADQVDAEIGNCATQRTLSEQGWNEADLIGKAFNLLDIPIGAVYSSEYCRAWKTARIAFGRPIKQSELNFEPAENFTPEQVATMRKAVTPMLSSAPSASTNTIIVGHDDPFEAATGIYPEPQGVAYVVKPKDNGEFAVIGAIAPSDWPSIIASAK